MMKTIVALAALLLTSHAAQQTPPAEPERVSCIDLSAVTARRAEGPALIRFEMIGGAVYRNRLPGRCPGLRRANSFGAMAFDVQGGRLCRGDRVRVVVDPAGCAVVPD